MATQAQSFNQLFSITSKNPDIDGFSKANFSIVEVTATAHGESLSIPVVVNGLIFDDYGIHVDKSNRVIVTHLPSGGLITSLVPRIGGVTKRKAIAKAMIKRFPLSVPGGIVMEKTETYSIGNGQEKKYTVTVLREEYAKEMSVVIAQELRGTDQLGRFG